MTESVDYRMSHASQGLRVGSYIPTVCIASTGEFTNLHIMAGIISLVTYI